MNPRFDYLDAVRAFALVLGVVFHAALSFMPFFIGWAVMDVSTSALAALFVLISHSFRMEVFFLIAGFFAHLTFHRRGMGAYLRSRLVRIVVPFVVGWFCLRPLLVSGWVMGGMSLRGDVDVLAGLRAGFASLGALPAGLFAGSHLWFLYYLILVSVGVIGLRAALKATGAGFVRLSQTADTGLRRLARSWFAIPALAAPTAGLLWFMRGWGMDTPDQSLAPHVPALAVYSGCFGLGWLLHRQAGLIAELSRVTVARWLALVASAPVVVLLAPLQGDPGHEYHVPGRAVFVAAYAWMMWTLVLLTIGLFRVWCSRPNRVIRYVADSSYWMYLVHLPIVVWLQVAVAELPWHWTAKLAAISTATIVICLVTYDLFVRSTLIGHVLSGSRRERVLFRGRG